MDPTIAVGTGLTILGSKDLLLKILGPSADYVGGEVKNFVEKCNFNLDGIFNKAARKLGDRMDEDGAVSPRILKHVVDEGRFCEDDLTAEYYGGILASSKSRIARDDRGVTLLAQVKDLSVYQLRFHFMAYMVMHRLFQGNGLNLGDGNDCHKMKVFVPMEIYEAAMAFQDGEDPSAILSHCLFGLNRHNLISDFASGNAEWLQKKNKGIAEAGVIFAPTLTGAELFLWAIGLQGATGRELVSVTITGAVDGVTVPDGSKSFTALDEELKAKKEAEKNEQQEANKAALTNPLPASESKPEGGANPKPESEVRPQ
jgi:hypothetical protein